MTAEAIREQVKAGRFDEARQALEAMGETDENRTERLFLQGRVQEGEYDRSGALATYEEVLNLDSEHKEARFRAALLADLLGDDDRAIELYERCVSDDSVPVNALINLAVLYEENGQLGDAEWCLKSVLTTYPNHRRARHFLSSVESTYTMVYDEKSVRDREHRFAVMDTPVTDFELSVRSRNCLRQMNIRTLGDLLRTTEAELLSYKNFGDTSLNEIQAMLRQKGLRLGQAISPLDGEGGPFGGAIDPIGASANPHLSRPVSELELSVRSRKCLQALGITTIGELMKRSETELMASKNFGQTSLAEIKHQLSALGLALQP